MARDTSPVPTFRRKVRRAKTAGTAKPVDSAHSQTLSRGIRLLEMLAEAPAPMTIAELAESLGVHRSIAYRILRTLEDHRLVMRDASGRVLPAPAAGRAGAGRVSRTCRRRRCRS